MTERCQLAELLRDCVVGGASIGFLADITEAEATEYWEGVLRAVAAGAKLLLVARDETGSIVGGVQLALENRRNGRHRAEVQKLMVLPALRGRDLGSLLMAEVEALARSRAVRLLYLDTSEGAGGAKAFYEKLGIHLCRRNPRLRARPGRCPHEERDLLQGAELRARPVGLGATGAG